MRDRGLHRTPLGALVLTCAAADDVTAWCLLAAVVALVKAGSPGSAGLLLLLLALAYGLLMVRGVRPLLARMGVPHHASGRPKKAALPVFFLTLILSAFAAEAIGIHALFGAFLAGAIMPGDTQLREFVSGKVQDVAVLLLLPLFFVFTGLRTEIGLLNSGYLWGVCGLIIIVAVIGKLLGSALAARFVGHGWPDSLRIGALMNTRGLMEIVVLNIGYDLGILTPSIFAMMVIMAHHLPGRLRPEPARPPLSHPKSPCRTVRLSIKKSGPRIGSRLFNCWLTAYCLLNHHAARLHGLGSSYLHHV